MTIRCPECKRILDNTGQGLKEMICTKCVALGKGNMAKPSAPIEKEPRVACFYQWLDKAPNQKLKLILQSSTEHLKPKEPVSIVLGFQQLKVWYYEMKGLIEKGPPEPEPPVEDEKQPPEDS